MKAKPVFAVSIIAVVALLGKAQGQVPPCKPPIEYGNRNQVDPPPSPVGTISGRVIAEVGRPAKNLGPVPGCLGLFTEEDHRLVASVVADRKGRFRFHSIAEGRYRLVVKDPQNAFCIANMPLIVAGLPQGKAKALVIHLRPAGVDECSYGDFK